VPILVGWMIGIAMGLAQAVLALTALTVSLPGIILTILTVFAIPVAILPLFIPILLLAIFYIAGYLLASISIASALPTTAFPLGTPFPTGVPVPLPPRAGELFARGFMIGMTAAINASIMALVPVIGIALSIWVFIIGSLSIFPTAARSVVYHGFLGWSAWLFPMSYFATAIGLVLFIISTAVFGGLVLWINAIDENMPPLRKLNLAYGELTAESHSQAMTPPLRNDFFVRLWA